MRRMIFIPNEAVKTAGMSLNAFIRNNVLTCAALKRMLSDRYAVRSAEGLTDRSCSRTERPTTYSAVTNDRLAAAMVKRVATSILIRQKTIIANSIAAYAKAVVW